MSALTPDVGCAANHAFYVGVSTYEYGRPNYGRGTFDSLQAATNDTEQIRRSLESRYQFESSETLLDGQASREAILGKLTAFATGAKGKAGDTLLFYFTGHGARLFDEAGTQATRFHSTILPYDARDPVRAVDGDYGDIIDVELKPLIAAISERGINVVTIFDSCNSGTATRSLWNKGRKKYAPAVTVRNVSSAVRSYQTAGPAGVRPGYVVHFAAAMDGTEAIERPTEDGPRSDFTDAVSKAIQRATPGATYKEIFSSAQLQMLQVGATQEPRAEGDLLTAFLGGTRGSARVIEGQRRKDGTYVLEAGSLAGIGPGTTFALFKSLRDAVSDRSPPIGTAKVQRVDPYEAQIAVHSEEPVLYALQRSPSFETEPLRVAVRASDSKRRAAEIAKLERYDFLQLTNANTAAYLLDLTDTTPRVVSATGDVVWPNRTGIDLPGFMQGLAKFHALLGLAEKADSLPIDLSFAATACDGSDQIPLRMKDGRPSFAPGDRFHLTLSNNDKRRAYYLYLISLGADYSIAVLHPPANANDQVAADRPCFQPLENRGASMSDAGTHHLLLIASEKPLPTVYMLEQGALRSAAAPTDPLEQLLYSAASGLRSGTPRGPVPHWGAKVISYTVEPRRNP